MPQEILFTLLDELQTTKKDETRESKATFKAQPSFTK